MEYRIKDIELTYEEGSLKVGGYINVTERESQILYSKKRGKWFKEVMKRGVFDSAIKASNQIPLLFEHNWEHKLASTSNDTLSLKEDNIGLRFDAVISDESVYEKVKKGVINACSFGFRALQEAIEPIDSKLEKRYVSSIELLEVSLVSNPAYLGSLVESRAYEEALKEEELRKEEETEEEVEEAKETGEVDSAQEPNKEEEPEKEELSEKEEVENSKEVEKEAEDNDSESEDKEVDEDRAFDNVEEVSKEVEAQSEMDNSVKEGLKELVDEVIESKEEHLKDAQVTEQIIEEHIQVAQQQHEEHLEGLKQASIGTSVEILKLKLELLKLKHIKESI